MTATEAVERILALRKLSDECGVITRRTQSELLASLTGETLTEVALQLDRIAEGQTDNDTTKQ